MKVHFIAIGGSAMHNLAISLHKKGYTITGSDDEIFEPSRSRLGSYGLLPATNSWDTEKIQPDIDAVILGMHARKDNPELIKSRELGLKIYSYPEYLYEQTKNKLRVVVGGSHGKTTITSMIMHVLKSCNRKFDYMVGAQLEGFETMVNLTHEAPVAVFEGDEYLSSALDPRPKFHLYRPNIAIISGIAWDHINVFPTFEIYKEQFRIFIEKINEGGTLFYCDQDKDLEEMVKKSDVPIEKIPYSAHRGSIKNGTTYLHTSQEDIPIEIFGDHNLQNISAAKLACNKLGIDDQAFYQAISNFKGASKRLEIIAKNKTSVVFRDFAHSPSKLNATVNAVKKQFPQKKLIAIVELHTFSSLSSGFLSEYKNSLNNAQTGIVYFNPEVIRHKKLPAITQNEVLNAFNNNSLRVITDKSELEGFLSGLELNETTVLLMSSGNFSGIDLKQVFRQGTGINS